MQQITRHTLVTLPVIFAATVTGAVCQVSIWTGQYDQGRTSSNLSETTLTMSNVNTTQFGLLFDRAVDDAIWAQPLYLPQVTISGSAHNVVYVATINNSVYAFDGDTASLSAPLWQVNLGTAAPIVPTKNGISHCGILSTPVIDQTSGTMYVVALTGTSTDQTYMLHALDITSGAEKFGGPATIRASVKGTGLGSVNGRIAFVSTTVLQRPALLLLKNNVYMGFASQKHESTNPFHGWLLGYNATTLKQTYVLNTTPDGGEGGLWMSGRGPAADRDGFTVITGNGDVGTRELGESFVRIGTNHKLLGTFTDPNWETLNTYDYDLGAGGALLLPGTKSLAGGGKTGTLYLVNITSTGALQMAQSFAATTGCSSSADSSCLQIHHLAFWNRAGRNPPLLYLWAANDTLKAFSFSGGLLSTTPVYQNSALSGFPGGGALAVSANGSSAASGILWATMSTQTASISAVPGMLRAFDAANVATELWNSNMSPADQLGNLAKFVVPVVANGKVYVATFSNQLAVYGLKSAN
jgi:hypothetical protein